MKNFVKSTSSWLDKHVAPRLGNNYSIKRKIVSDDQFGDRVGIDFDSFKKTGYIYVWSGGMLGFGLYNKEMDEEIVSQHLEEVDGFEKINDMLLELFNKI